MDFYGSICLSDITEDMVKVANNGKKYLNVIIGERREVSKMGNTHYIKAYVPKEKYDMNKNYFIGEVKPREQKP